MNGSAAIAGDLVRDAESDAVVVLTAEQAEELNAESANPLACVLLPLAGPNALVPANAVGDKCTELLEAHDTKEALSATGPVKGSYRALVAVPTDVEWSFEPGASMCFQVCRVVGLSEAHSHQTLSLALALALACEQTSNCCARRSRCRVARSQRCVCVRSCRPTCSERLAQQQLATSTSRDTQRNRQANKSKQHKLSRNTVYIHRLLMQRASLVCMRGSTCANAQTRLH